MANLSATEHDINLSVLQQKDPYIVAIADSASQVAAYSFNSISCEWEKTNVEGTLFVYTRSAFPINGFMIINRLHLDDLIEPISKNLEFQLQDPFLLYKNSQSESIYGIWFYDRDECARIGQLMNSLVQVAIETQNQEQSRQRRASESDTGVVIGHRVVAGEAPTNQISPRTANIDILQLLSKAQDEYDKSKQVRRSKTSESSACIDFNKVPMNGEMNSPLKTSKQHQHQPLTSSLSSSTSSSINKQFSNISANFRPHGSDCIPAQPMCGNTNSTTSGTTTTSLQHPTATHITLEALFKRASLQQHRDEGSGDKKFAPGGPNSAFHLPPAPPLSIQATPTVEEIEKAHRDGSINPPVNNISSGTITIASVGGGNGSNGGGGRAQAGSAGSNRLVARCGSDSSFSESSYNGVAKTKPVLSGSTTDMGLDLKELHMQLMGGHTHLAAESPNTTLKRTLNIAPIPHTSNNKSSPSSAIIDQQQVFSREKFGLQQNSLSSNLQRQVQKDSNLNSKQGTTNTLVQALFLREQQQQQQQMQQQTVTSTPDNVTDWINKSNFPLSSSHTSQDNGPKVLSGAQEKSFQLEKQQSQPPPEKSLKSIISSQPIEVPKPFLVPTTKGLSQVTAPSVTTTSVASIPQLSNIKQKQTTNKTVSEMLSKPNSFLTFIKSEPSTSPNLTTTLLSPMVFQSSRSTVASNQKTNLQNNPTSAINTLSSTILAPITSHQLHDSTKTNRNEDKKLAEENKTDDDDDDTDITPLTKEQLRQALSSLLKNDPQFLTSIHEAYMSSLKRASKVQLNTK